MVVGLLGILKAGGAYVPFDPTHPAERIAMVLEDAGVAVLIDDDFLDQIASDRADRPERWTDDESLAYVIYTSGSTGRPKGVQLPHRAVVNFLRAMAVRPGFRPQDAIPALTTLSFDIAGLEIYLPLMTGGRIEVMTREEASDGRLLGERLAASGVTVMQATPATWRLLIDAGWEGLLGLKGLCGGEALPRELAMELLAHGVELWNVYGPTETAIWSAAGKILPGEDGPVRLGQPIDNTRFYVVDPACEPVPVGVPGELWIAGDGVARGYFRRADLTAEKFIADPFSATPGARLYRTGDLVRYREGGAIEFLGRIDHQVKVRGFRIELGEIEAALSRHPAVAQAVVEARGEGGEKRLVAYLVPHENAAVPELRAHLQASLPDYMVPAVFVVLDVLPLNPSGKVDRKALPEPDAPATTAEHVAPQGPVEELVAGIWAEVLRAERIGATDSFFDLGGHSLLATQVISRLRAALGVELPLQRLFEAPTVADLARAVEAARGEGMALQLPPLVPVARDGGLPLSFAQERMWFLQQLEPSSAAYNIAAAVRLVGDLDTAVLERCFTELVRRHEALRTVFAAVEGRPVQVVQAPAAFRLAQVDLRVLPAEQREAAARRLAAAEADRPFDLAAGPLVRALLLPVDEGEHLLLLGMHHIVSDGWSMRLLVRELGALYQGSPLADLPLQYADFAAWQRSWLDGEILDRQLGFWKCQLAGAPALLELPTDRPRPAMQTANGARLPLALMGEAVRELSAFGRRQGLTPFMWLLAAFDALLGRYAGTADVVVGVPIAGRQRSEVERIVGSFVNMLVLRTRLDGGPSFAELARQVRGVSLDAFAHQDLPFEKLVDELRPERSLSHAPLFQVMFNLQNQPAGALETAGLSLVPVEIERSQAQLELSLILTETPDGFAGQVEYNTDLFDRSTIERFVGHLATLLAAAAADPGRKIEDLPLLTEGERRQLLEDWNATAVDHPRGVLIHELFEAQAAQSPERPAVSCGGEVLTYRDLDERSNRLANHLRRLGVGPEVLVGLCVERSAEMVVGLLGILKAGGAYVPLDPSHPAERRSLVLEDAGVALLITDDFEISAESTERPARWTDDESLAYVIYTSGSTGRPKGVQLPHRAVVNFLRAMAVRPGFGPDDVIPALTTLTFDIAGLEIWLPLMVGGRIEVMTREEASDGRLLAERISAAGATVVQATPATWRMLLDAGWEGGLKALCGGEALPRELADALLARGVELWNVYGPTETAVWSSVGEVTPEGPVWIGAPIDNTRFYVVDPSCQPTPLGVPGELWIAGDGVARGYLGRPDLTAEKFIADPFSQEPGGRLYRTGDLVRYRENGALEMLGRIDHQVKVRGFRIELGEIEAALGRHPAIAQAVAVARGEASDKRLIAYLVGREDYCRASGDLRTFLQTSLPDYMVPGVFVVLDVLPLTPSGKVDRKALPEPTAAATASHVAPRGPVEELLAGIWAEVLRVERVGAADNFFELGGHSLLATQVVSRIRAALGVELPLQRLFEAPTVAGLARAVEAARREEEGSALPPLVRVPRDGELPAVLLPGADVVPPATGWSAERPTTSPGRSACADRSTRRCWSRPSASWSAATRCCARRSLWSTAGRSRWCASRSRSRWAGWTSARWRLPSGSRRPAASRARRSAAPSTLPWGRCSAPRCSGWTRRSTCWCSSCTISPRMAGRCRSSSATSPSSTVRRRRTRRRSSPSCRSSTPTMPPGNGGRFQGRCSRPRWAGGAAVSRAPCRRCCCRPTAAAHRSTASRSRPRPSPCRPSCSRRSRSCRGAARLPCT